MAGRRELERIAAMLLSFAALAERAAGRSLAVRWLVLVLLRRGEAVVASHLARTTPLAWPEVGDRAGFAPADALCLAVSLRAMAALLVSLAAWLADGRRRAAAFSRAPGRLRLVAMAVAAAGDPHDTS